MPHIQDFLAEDWAIMDDIFTLTYFARKAGGTGFEAGRAVANTIRNAVTKDDAAFLPASLLQQRLTVFNLWKSKLGGVEPKTTDVVEDDRQRRWVVQRVQEMDEGERFRLTCSRER